MATLHSLLACSSRPCRSTGCIEACRPEGPAHLSPLWPPAVIAATNGVDEILQAAHSMTAQPVIMGWCSSHTSGFVEGTLLVFVVPRDIHKVFAGDAHMVICEPWQTCHVGPGVDLGTVNLYRREIWILIPATIGHQHVFNEGKVKSHTHWFLEATLIYYLHWDHTYKQD